MPDSMAARHHRRGHRFSVHVDSGYGDTAGGRHEAYIVEAHTANEARDKVMAIHRKEYPYLTIRRADAAIIQSAAQRKKSKEMWG
jgi:hypothetical protein